MEIATKILGVVKEYLPFLNTYLLIVLVKNSNYLTGLQKRKQ
jgi:hypothetical protein